MAEYDLYCFAQSGNAYKVALYLELAGLDWRPVFVDYMRGGETRTPAYREAINEMGEAPVLVHRGRKRTQSGAILTYLADTTGHFAPQGEAERYEALRWMLFDNHKFTSYFATLRFMLAFARTGETPVTEFLRGRATAAWGIADKHLAGSPFMLGARPTIADISMAGYVFYPEETGIDWGSYPHLAAWRERIRALPLFRGPYELMPDAPCEAGAARPI